MLPIVNQYQFVISRINHSIQTQQQVLQLVNWLGKYFYLQNSKNEIIGSVINNGVSIPVVYINPNNGKVGIDSRISEQYYPNFNQYLTGIKARGVQIRLNSINQQFELQEQVSSSNFKVLKSLLLTLYIKTRFYFQ